MPHLPAGGRRGRGAQTVDAHLWIEIRLRLGMAGLEEAVGAVRRDPNGLHRTPAQRLDDLLARRRPRRCEG